MIGRCVAKKPYMNLVLNNNVTDTGTGGNTPSNTGVTFTTDQFGRANMAGSWADNSDRLSWASSIGNTIAEFINDKITVCMFSKPKAAINFAAYLNQRSSTGSDNSYSFNQYNFSSDTNQIRMNTNPTGGLFSTVISPNNVITNSVWQFIVLKTIDNSTDLDVFCYVDNVEVINSNLPYTKTNSSIELRIGARAGDNTLGDLGDLNNFRIYNVTLSAGQIKILNNEKGRIRA